MLMGEKIPTAHFSALDPLLNPPDFTKTFHNLQSSHPPAAADQFRCSEFTDITRSQAKRCHQKIKNVRNNRIIKAIAINIKVPSSSPL